MASEAVCTVVRGKVAGTWSIDCSFCGHCGGNYGDHQTAAWMALVHQNMDVPEHHRKK